MSKIKPGAKFCRILTTSIGQQVLLALDNDSDGRAVILGSATFITERGACLVHLELEANHDEYVTLLEAPMTEEQERDAADKICFEIQNDLFNQLYPQYKATHNTFSHNPH